MTERPRPPIGEIVEIVDCDDPNLVGRTAQVVDAGDDEAEGEITVRLRERGGELSEDTYYIRDWAVW